MVGVNVSPVSVTAGAADAGVFRMHHDIIPKSPTKTTIPTVPILFPLPNFLVIFIFLLSFG
jgi:hypothetical protein